MKITSKGQVTIPLEVRRKLGLLPDTQVDFVVEGASARLVKRKLGSSRGAGVIGRLRGTGTVKMSTDEILAFTREK
ncbi:MAG: AbrB/MazE/SpoVT family DNA-binding domain-containing protein [Actinomycetota bacterium]